MRETGVRLLIAEPSSNAALVSQVAARSGARAVVLVPSVGAAPEAGDYLAPFEVNVRPPLHTPGSWSRAPGHPSSPAPSRRRSPSTSASPRSRAARASWG